jgi:hypothetical protein
VRPIRLAALGCMRLAALGCVVLLAAGCSATVNPTRPAGSAASGLDASPSFGVPATIGPPPSPTPPDEATPVVLDPTVLSFLPLTVGDIPVTESADEATQALSDPSLGRIGTAIDAGVAVDIGSGNLVHAWVVRLRTDMFTETIYRQWRDSYDQGACAAAGGVVGTAEATIDDRTVYITTCGANVRTYHVWLEQAGILISASATGDGRFGQLLMDNLRVPS